ncbi:hypothetical protein ATANTOWER_028599 [Ataeniobius toweri]|uniref:Uncharacterized protein n=1 Tax=Ataeniobius toweri TaxID=208326 RepID=A0ABU7B937_9TELE|nr:hypothetical protein [Ataeniobius toweri]
MPSSMECTAYCGPMILVSAGELCNSFWVIFGLCAPFLNNALLVRPVSFVGRSSPGSFVVVPCVFHLRIMGLMVLQGKTIKPHPGLYYSTSLSLTFMCDASCSVVLQPLGPSGKGVFIPTDHLTLTLHTGRLHFTNVTF